MKTKLLFFYAGDFLGSVWTVCRQIIRHLDPKQFEIHVIIERSVLGHVGLDEREGLIIRRWDLGLRVGRIRAPVGAAVPVLTRMPDLVRYVRQQGIHLIHSNDDGYSFTLGLVLARLSGARFLLHHHTVLNIYGPVRRRLIESVARRADYNVGVSRFIAEELQKAGVPAAKLGFVVNGTDPSRFQPGTDGAAIRREYGIAADEILIMQLSRIWKLKRQEDFVRAFASARREVPKLRGLIVGWEDPRYEGPFKSYSDELRHLCEEQKLGESLLIMPSRPEAPELHAAADIEVLPSIEDPCPLVVVEAMASGKPVIGAHSGGTPEMIEDGITGFLVPPCSPAPIAAKITLLAKDKALRERIGANARRAVEQRLSDARVAEQFAAIYTRIAHGGAVP